MLVHSWSTILLFGLHSLLKIFKQSNVFNVGSPKTFWYSYSQRLHRLNLQSLKLRRLLTDLVWCYTVVVGMVDINIDDFFSFTNSVVIRGHQYKLYKKRIRATFFGERVINVWNSLPKDVDFSSLLRLQSINQSVNFYSGLSDRSHFEDH